MKEVAMRERNKFSLSSFVLLVVLSLISCTAKLSTAEPSLILTNTPLPQITSTALPLPTSTVFPLTITPPSTISGISTLSPDKAYLELENLLRTDCVLPCFAGITPGETLLVDASKTLFPFIGISDWTSLSERGGQLGINLPKEDLILNLFFQIYSSRNENQVQLFRVFTEALQEIEKGSYQWIYDAKPYHEVFGAYSLQNILATFGKPSEIYMTVEINEAEYNSPDFVLLWLMYPQKGFIAKYTANAEVIEGIVHGCPSKTFVELWLFSPYYDEKYKEDLLPFDMELGYVLPTPSIRTKPISDGIGMSVDEFYQVFSQPTNQCLETPRSKWAEF